MDSKKYLDKVVEFILRDTKIDYEMKEIHFTFLPNVRPLPFQTSHKLNFLTHSTFFDTFVKYCRDIFGLTNREMDYVYRNYSNIILDKIEDGE